MNVSLAFLLEASRTTLDSYILARYNEAAKFAKQIRALGEAQRFALAEAFAAEWVRDHRTELLRGITTTLQSDTLALPQVSPIVTPKGKEVA